MSTTMTQEAQCRRNKPITQTFNMCKLLGIFDIVPNQLNRATCLTLPVSHCHTDSLLNCIVLTCQTLHVTDCLVSMSDSFSPTLYCTHHNNSLCHWLSDSSSPELCYTHLSDTPCHLLSDTSCHLLSDTPCLLLYDNSSPELCCIHLSDTLSHWLSDSSSPELCCTPSAAESGTSSPSPLHTFSSVLPCTPSPALLHTSCHTPCQGSTPQTACVASSPGGRTGLLSPLSCLHGASAWAEGRNTVLITHYLLLTITTHPACMLSTSPPQTHCCTDTQDLWLKTANVCTAQGLWILHGGEISTTYLGLQ